jgi:hypothetical protein
VLAVAIGPLAVRLVCGSFRWTLLWLLADLAGQHIVLQPCWLLRRASLSVWESRRQSVCPGPAVPGCLMADRMTASLKSTFV